MCGDDYEVFRCDRCHLNSRKVSGGGVLLAIRQAFQARELKDPMWSIVEQVWVSIKLFDHTVFICVVYFPPDRVRDLDLIDVHAQSLQYMISLALPRDEIIVLGDFNLPGIKWKPWQHGFLHVDTELSTFHAGTASILDNYSTCTLLQINNVTNENGRIVDLCFVSDRDVAPNICTAPAPW